MPTNNADGPTAISIRFPPGMADTVRQRLHYGDSLNGWVIGAVRQRLERDPVQLDQTPGPDALRRRRHPMAPTVDTVDPTTGVLAWGDADQLARVQELVDQMPATAAEQRSAADIARHHGVTPSMVASFDPDAEDGGQ
jgi:hypothetical protein